MRDFEGRTNMVNRENSHVGMHIYKVTCFLVCLFCDGLTEFTRTTFMYFAFALAFHFSFLYNTPQHMYSSVYLSVRYRIKYLGSSFSPNLSSSNASRDL